MKCENCGSKETRVKIYTEEFSRNGKTIKVKGKGRFCLKCGSPIYDSELDSKMIEEANIQYNRKYGIPGEKIVNLRKKLHLSQADLSKVIGCAKKTLISYEKNTSTPNDNYEIILNLLIENPSIANFLLESNKYKYDDKEYNKISNRIELFLKDYEDSDDYILSRANELTSFNGYTLFNYKKFLNVILFFAKDGILKTKLLKEIFYSDFIHYKNNATSITGSNYAHITYGPVPDKYEYYLNEFVSKGYIDCSVEYKGNYESFVIKDKIEFDPFLFSKSELDTLNKIKKFFKDYNSGDIAKFSHEEKAYKETKQNELISYDYSFDIDRIK